MATKYSPVYQFSPHFHPYVGELVRSLMIESVPGLQAEDTKYKRTDGLFETLPESRRVTLEQEVTISHTKGDNKTLVKGTPLVLLESCRVRLADGTVAQFPGMIEPHTGNMEVRLADTGKAITIESETSLELVDATTVALPDGFQERLPKNTRVRLKRARPRPERFDGAFFKEYLPSDEIVLHPRPVKDLDFTPSGAYSVYNWELFYHVPLVVAMHLSKNQRFDEAQRWFHYIFDPTDDSDGPTPERFWQVKPFQTTDVQLIGDLLVNLSTGEDPVLQQDTIACIQAWHKAPFRPHLVARYRQTAYMFKAVMAYLDNLIAWGDSLFRQDTVESINEATQLYVLAANILGPRPQAVPAKSTIRPQTYARMKQGLNEFGNAQVEWETKLPFVLLTQHAQQGGLQAGASLPRPGDGVDSAGLLTASTDVDSFVMARSLGQTLYFCTPRNDKLLTYWDTMADRLFKIHNSLNIQGIFRQLPLFEPPIDPALLVRAVAAGLDIGAVVSGLYQPLPLVRFQLLAQKAAEICQEVKTLGNNLLSAMEKEDNEALAILRAKHERVILDLTEAVKYAQWQEAIKSYEGLEKSFLNAAQRFIYYEKLLGRQESEITLPEWDALDADALASRKFRQVEPELASPRDIVVDVAQDNSALREGGIISTHELKELNLLQRARDLQEVVAALELTGKALNMLPDFIYQYAPMGSGWSVQYNATSKAATTMSFAADIMRLYADRNSYQAGMTAKIGSYARREQEWAFQSHLAAGEITQIYKQLRAAQIREAIAKREWENHQKVMQHAAEIEQFLTDERVGKKTNQAFYTWMKREVKGLYGQVFQFAFDIAKKAERALQHELGDPNLTFLQFGYLAGKEGLLAGEKLYLDIKRMEMAYHELNQREYELTKHISLLQVDPLALIQLRMTGRCTVRLPESLFDMDGPGHYFRRIKTVAVSIPCVTGPYASVNCTLTLLKSSIRKTQILRIGGYAREDAEDDRFGDYFGSMQSIVTSSAQNDSGMFETNLRDERYLPFEGSGVISEWQLQLPANPSKGEPQQFDYGTISDVILHVRYTAREGGGLLRNGAVKNLQDSFVEATAAGSVRLFSVRHEFSTAWAKFKSTKIAGDVAVAKLTLDLSAEHYPFWSRDQLKAVTRAEVLARAGEIGCEISQMNGTGGSDTIGTLVKDASLGLLFSTPLNIDKLSLKQPTGKLELCFTDNSMDDLWLAVTWSSGAGD